MNQQQAVRPRIIDRISYRLSFSCTPADRSWSETYLLGENIPNAYDGGTTDTCGDWDHPDGIENMTDVITVVLGEAVHEALEWLRVDGEQFLDPHGNAELAIHQAVAHLAERINEIAEQPKEAVK